MFVFWLLLMLIFVLLTKLVFPLVDAIEEGAMGVPLTGGVISLASAVLELCTGEVVVPVLVGVEDPVERGVLLLELEGVELLPVLLEPLDGEKDEEEEEEGEPPPGT